MLYGATVANVELRAYKQDQPGLFSEYLQEQILSISAKKWVGKL